MLQNDFILFVFGFACLNDLTAQFSSQLNVHSTINKVTKWLDLKVLLKLFWRGSAACLIILQFPWKWEK